MRRPREAKVEAFSKLEPEQRHHYKMKDGFKQDRKDATHDKRVGDLYKRVPDEVMQTLDGGFEKDIAKLFEDTNSIPVAWLRKDNQEDEAIEIVESILRNL